MPDDLFIAAIDVGTYKNWGLAYKTNSGSVVTLPRQDACLLASMLAQGLSSRAGLVALGFEAPLWVPARNQPGDLLKARDKKEVCRPWSAGAGCAVITALMAVLPWWLSAIRGNMAETPRATTDMRYWQPGVLLIWEAFVSGKGKTKNSQDQNRQDAYDAVAEFYARAVSGHIVSDFEPSEFTENKSFSLVAPHLHFSGWEILGNEHHPAIVVKTSEQ